MNREYLQKLHDKQKPVFDDIPDTLRADLERLNKTKVYTPYKELDLEMTEEEYRIFRTAFLNNKIPMMRCTGFFIKRSEGINLARSKTYISHELGCSFLEVSNRLSHLVLHKHYPINELAWRSRFEFNISRDAKTTYLTYYGEEDGRVEIGSKFVERITTRINEKDYFLEPFVLPEPLQDKNVILRFELKYGAVHHSMLNLKVEQSCMSNTSLFDYYRLMGYENGKVKLLPLVPDLNNEVAKEIIEAWRITL